MAIFADASIRTHGPLPGFQVEVRVQYTNRTGGMLQLKPRQAVFELLDPLGQFVHRHSPDVVPESVWIPPRGCFRFEFSFAAEVDPERGNYSLLCKLGNESGYSLVQSQAAAKGPYSKLPAMAGEL